MKNKYSKKILNSMLIFLAVFIAICLYITLKTSVEPSTLITCVFSFCGIEGGLLAWIKITKEKVK